MEGADGEEVDTLLEGFVGVDGEELDTLLEGSVGEEQNLPMEIVDGEEQNLPMEGVDGEEHNIPMEGGDAEAIIDEDDPLLDGAAKRFWQGLVKYFGFEKKNVSLLLHRNNPENGTGTNILRNLDDMIAEVVPSDKALFYYCGHGGFTPTLQYY